MTLSLNRFKIFFLLLLIVYGPTSYACFNESFITKNGESVSRHSPMPVFYSDHDSISARNFLKEYDLDDLTKYEFFIQSDIAVKLSYLGEHARALSILKRLQQEHPEDYSITANLGTSYELNGNNEMALLFIKKGIAINPQSHNGSEWIHLKILEAKMALKKNSHWLRDHAVLGTGINFNSSRKGTDSVKDLVDAIEYQLTERVPFTKFPDPVLAAVFNELGDIYAVEISVEMAHIAYGLSAQNNGEHLYGLKSKQDQVAAVLRKNNIPIPDWRDHYYSHNKNQILAFLEEKGKKMIQADPGKAAGGIKALIDSFEDKNKRSEENKRMNLFIWIFSSLLVTVGAFVFFKQYLKKRRRQNGEE